jgi:hypothetical protein
MIYLNRSDAATVTEDVRDGNWGAAIAYVQRVYNVSQEDAIEAVESVIEGASHDPDDDITGQDVERWDMQN